MLDLTKPWEINLTAPVYAGMVGWLLENGWTKEELSKGPTELDSIRIEKVVRALLGPKNWVVCYSSSPSYIRYIMGLSGAVWAMTTGKRLRILSYKRLAEILMDRDSEDKYIIAETDLLVLSYSDPSQPLISKFRGSFADLMLQRKHKKLPTITDIQVPRSARSKKELVGRLSILEEFFGKIWLDLFTKDDAKYLFFKD